MRAIGIVITVFLTGCDTASVPAKPGYDTDIAPILEANCVRCHSASTAVTLGNCLELDIWDDGTDPTSMCSPLLGVHSSLSNPTNPTLELLAEIESNRMPKDGPALTDRQKQIFENWKEEGYPRAGGTTNHPPTITFLTPPAGGATINTGGVTTYDIQYDVSDPDGDPVTWSLGYTGPKSGTFATNLMQGMGTVHADTSTLGPGTYQVVATLSDGIVTVMDTAQGTLTVPSNYNAVPTVSLTNPTTGSYYYQGETMTITWLGNDDGPTLTCDVVVSYGATTIPLVTGLAETPGVMASTTWNIPSNQTLSPSYSVTVTVHDNANQTATAQATSISIGPPPQQVSFSTQLVPLFTNTTDGCIKTGCHGSINPQQGLDLTAAKAYNDIVNVAAQQTATCSSGSEMLIAPGDPNHSYLIAKLQGSGNCFTGSRMPKGETAFTSTQIQLFIDWTLNGAPNN